MPISLKRKIEHRWNRVMICLSSQINKDDQYFLCLSPGCVVAYFSIRCELILKSALSVLIWFKEKSPVPICYCRDVTDEDFWKYVAT